MKSAPFECPRCGTEKEWRCTNDPGDNEMNPVAQQAIVSGFGLIGLGIAKLLYRGKKLQYRCGKCGFTGSYKPD